MIITRTPLRISFVGGSSDFPDFYLRHGGAVVSATIDKYVYIIVNKRFDDSIRVSYSKTEIVNGVNEIQHSRVREALKLMGISKGIEIVSVADVPAGTGLGSSSSFSVGLINALYAYKKQGIKRYPGTKVLMTPKELAELACYLELDVLNEPIGKQDQYAAAYGGMNHIEFKKSGEVQVEQVTLSEEKEKNINQNLMLFYTGTTREASEILAELKSNLSSENYIEYLCGQRNLAIDLKHRITDTYGEDSIGRFMHVGWMLKRKLMNDEVNSIYDLAYSEVFKCGVLGGKVVGAGSGGFLLLYCPLSCQQAVREVLSGYTEMSFRIDKKGSEVVYES